MLRISNINEKCLEQILEATANKKNRCTVTRLLSDKPLQLDEQDIGGTAGEARKNSRATLPIRLLLMDAQGLTNQQRLISTLGGHRMQLSGPVWSDG